MIFKPSKQWNEDIERSIKLWAYGGNTALQLRDVERGPIGVSFLKMADTSEIQSSTLRRKFAIYNKGPLNGVATIFVKSKNNQYSKENHISIEPSKCVIRPDSFNEITVTYKLRRKDLDKLSQKNCEVLTIGSLEVITGSEPNRHRIASIMKQNRSSKMCEQFEFLVNDFPIETNECFDDFKETAEDIPDLFGCFKISEIALTINNTTLDETQNPDFTIDDSVLFKTIIETTKSDPPKTVTSSHQQELWSVYPKQLIMDRGTSSRKTISIQSFFKQPQTFQIQNHNFFNLSQTSGYIQPGNQCDIIIELRKDANIMPNAQCTIEIYIETGCIEIPVKIQSTPFDWA